MAMFLRGRERFLESAYFFPSNMKWKNAYDRITTKYNFASFHAAKRRIVTTSWFQVTKVLGRGWSKT